MDVVGELLKEVPLPRMVKVRQSFAAAPAVDVAAVLRRELAKPGIAGAVRPGMRIALAVGSRGVDGIATLVRETAATLKELGALPFVVPAMGSHGGATAAGQEAVLASLGVTAESAGCPVCSCMDTIAVGRLDNGLPVLIDRLAHEADGIVVINRVKPHNAFRGPSESGLVKMLAIGLGKQQGADSCHAYGFGRMAEFIVAMAAIKLAACRVLFGVATVENAYDRAVLVEAVPAAELIAADQRLLTAAKANMPRIMFDPIDVLIVDRIGKEYSGGGMDGNITGRHPTPFISGGPRTSRIAVLDVTDKSRGNAAGVGMADVTTRRLVDKIDYAALYTNALTSTVLETARIPLVAETERDAVRAALKTCGAGDLSAVRVVRIKNSLHLDEIYISAALVPEAEANPAVDLLGAPREMAFDSAGNIADPW
ncbi:MAG: lactate racemase domain-containing protein [Sporomusaceae bacterium]|nr:lactate racemase domain-containing protein [Sporomusaceae bacterium]